MSLVKCPTCDGHGLVADYGPLSSDFIGPKDCRQCGGSGRVQSRDIRGRFDAPLVQPIAHNGYQAVHRKSLTTVS